MSSHNFFLFPDYFSLFEYYTMMRKKRYFFLAETENLFTESEIAFERRC